MDNAVRPWTPKLSDLVFGLALVLYLCYEAADDRYHLRARLEQRIPVQGRIYPSGADTVDLGPGHGLSISFGDKLGIGTAGVSDVRRLHASGLRYEVFLPGPRLSTGLAEGDRTAGPFQPGPEGIWMSLDVPPGFSVQPRAYTILGPTRQADFRVRRPE